MSNSSYQVSLEEEAKVLRLLIRSLEQRLAEMIADRISTIGFLGDDYSRRDMRPLGSMVSEALTQKDNEIADLRQTIDAILDESSE